MDFEEMTRLRDAEEKLRYSEEKLNEILYNSLDAVYKRNLQTNGYEYLSPAFTRLSGIMPEEISGMTLESVRSLIHPDDLPGIESMLDEAMKKEKNSTNHLEYRFRHKDGHYRWFGERFTVVHDTLGKPAFIVGNVRDISDRKHAETLLQLNRDNFETFFNTIDEFLFVLDEQGNIIHANSTVYDRLGYTREELEGKSVLLIHPSERRAEAGRIVGEMLEGITESCPVPIITKSGIQIPVETRISHGFWDGKPAIFGVTKDISQVRLSEEKFSKLFHLNPFACGLSDLDTHEYIEVNEVFCTFFGYATNEVIGKTAMDLGIIPDEARELILHNADSSGKIINVQADLKARNGDIKHVLLSADNIFVQDKKYRFTVVHDVTEQKNAEIILREQESSLRVAQKIARMGSWDWDLRTQKTNWSENYYAILGLKPNETEPGFDLFRKIVHPDDVRLLDEIHAGILRDKEPVSFELRIILPGGEIKSIENNLMPVVEKNEVVKLMGVIIDVTQRKQSEAEINYKNEELLRLLTEKDKFFSIISHDLRTPFNAFLGYTRMMVEDLPTLRLDEIQKMALSMRKSATNLYDLLENLLEWSRIQQGLISFNPEAVRLLAIMDECTAILHEWALAKGIEITTEIPDHLETFVDKNILQTIIRNFISNAIKFTPKGGKIMITAELSGEGHIKITIRDNGIGMNPSIVENLFRLDAQTNRKGTEGEPSTGLGLIICKDFIENQGGNIRVESEEGKGSTVHFTVPRHIEKQQGKIIPLSSPDKPDERKTKNLKILIVEDDTTSKKILIHSLKKFASEIFEANTGIEAIETHLKHPGIDLVLMDVNLPEMDGFEASRLIRKEDKDVVIIAQTAYTQPGYREIAIEAGCNDYITKPISNEQLMRLIKRYWNIFS